MNSTKQSATGFTLIELVVVIAVLSILAVIALPKFAEIADDAHRATVEAAGGSYVAAVNLVRSQWYANGATGAVDNVPGYGEPNPVIDVSTDGWPTGTNGNNDPDSISAAECNNLWEELMSTTSITASTGTGDDYQTSISGSDCRYTYLVSTDGYYIEYDPNTGNVLTELNP